MIFATLPVIAYTISIVGAHGRLGRELTMQSLQRGWNVCGVVRRPDEPVFLPSRRGWLTEYPELNSVPIVSDRLVLTSDVACTRDTDAIVFAMSSQPFASREEMQTQNEVVRRMCSSARNTNCSKICLVSAFGAGDSLHGANVGYQVMHSIYLKEGYAAKEAQEDIVSDLEDVETLILRPKVLSFEKIPFNSFAVLRSDLAEQILDWVGCESTG